MKKRMTLMIIFLVVIFGAVFGWDAMKSHMMANYFANYQPPPVTISTTNVERVTWKPFMKAIGTLKAVNGVNLSPEISGIIEKIYFKSGQLVKTGQPLLKIDDSVEQAELQNNQAALQLSQLNYQRMTKLYKRNATSKSQVDEANANLKQSNAAVNKTNALIAQKNMTAPFAGKIGIRQINIGQYVSPGTTLVTLQALTPIYVDFYLPEQDLPKIYINQPISVQVETYPKQSFVGKIMAINATVDINTHNILIRAMLPNQNKKLYPGLYANIRLQLPQEKNSITVPTTAVTFSLFGNSVYVIYHDGKDKKGKPVLRVKERFVKIGDTQGARTVITGGLKVDEEVVTSGQLKLHSDTRVVINNSVKLDANKETKAP